MSVERVESRSVPRLDLGVTVKEYIDQENEFIGTKVLPIFRTQKQKATFPAITRESMTRDADTKRAKRGKYNRDGFSAKELAYACVEHGLEDPLDDSERELYATDFDAELVSTQITTRRVLQAQEKRIADHVFNTTTFNSSKLFTDNTVNPWTNPDSKIIDQIRTSKEQIRKNCGIYPNALIASAANLERMKSNSQILDLIKYTARPTDAEVKTALSDLFGVNQILSGKAIRNTAKEGKAFSGVDIWNDNYVLLAVIAGNGQDLGEPSLGRTFLWIEDSPENITVEQYRANDIRSDVFRVRQYVDERVIDPYFGHLIKVAS